MVDIGRVVALGFAGLFMLGWTYVWLRYALYRGLQALSSSLALRATATGIADLSPGRVTVSGTAREDGGTVTAPLTDTDCLAYRVDLDTYSSGGTDGGSTYFTVETVEDGRQFLLDDGVESLDVDPAEARLSLESHETVKGEVEDDNPAHVERLLEDGGAHFDPEHGGGGRFRVVEHRLHDGDETVVHGLASEEGGRARIADSPEEASLADYVLLDSFFVAAEEEVPAGITISLVLIGIGVVTTALGISIGLEVVSMAT